MRQPYKWIALAAMFPLAIVFGSVLGADIDWAQLLGDEDNGLLARFGEHGVLKNNVIYLADNITGGVGLWVSDGLYYTDSGFILMMLRTGIFGMLAFYLLFMRSFLLNAGHRLELVVLIAIPIMIFEIGYPGLLTSRVYFLIPFIWACAYATEDNIKHLRIIKC